MSRNYLHSEKNIVIERGFEVEYGTEMSMSGRVMQDRMGILGAAAAAARRTPGLAG